MKPNLRTLFNSSMMIEASDDEIDEITLIRSPPDACCKSEVSASSLPTIHCSRHRPGRLPISSFCCPLSLILPRLIKWAAKGAGRLTMIQFCNRLASWRLAGNSETIDFGKRRNDFVMLSGLGGISCTSSSKMGFGIFSLSLSSPLLPQLSTLPPSPRILCPALLLVGQ